jgi:hypothetical protein
VPGVSIRKTVISKPIYFGQKDLAGSGSKFEQNLVEKLLGDKLIEVRIDIDAKKKKVQDAVKRYKNLADIETRKTEFSAKKADAEAYCKYHGRW